MPMRPRTVLLTAFIAAVVVFCVVQDRVTARGAQQYAEQQRRALSGRGTPVTIDEVVAPAVRRSLQQGLLWGGLVMGAGIVIAMRRRP
jgi:hypothetical protein